MRWTHLSTVTIAAVSLLCVIPFGPAQGQVIDLASTRVVDLTHPFDKDTIYWPGWGSGFELKPIHKGLTSAGFYFAAYSFCAPEHGGTHLDAPAHFAEGFWTTAEIPVERFIGPAVVIDVKDKTKEDRDYALNVEDVTAWENEHGKIPAGAIVLLRTGWSSQPSWPCCEARETGGAQQPWINSSPIEGDFSFACAVQN